MLLSKSLYLPAGSLSNASFVGANNVSGPSPVSSGKHVREMFTPLNPTFYIAKLGYAGVYLIFLFLPQNIDCGYTLEPPRRGGSNVYPQSMF